MIFFKLLENCNAFLFFTQKKKKKKSNIVINSKKKEQFFFLFNFVGHGSRVTNCNFFSQSFIRIFLPLLGTKEVTLQFSNHLEDILRKLNCMIDREKDMYFSLLFLFACCMVNE